MGNPSRIPNRTQAYLTGQPLVEYIARDTGCTKEPNADGQYTGGSCPVHGHKDNFSVALGENGMPLVHCFHICTSEEIVDHYRRRGIWPPESGPRQPLSTPQEDFAQFATGTGGGNRSGGTTGGAGIKNPAAKANAKRAYENLLGERAKQERLDAAKEAWRILHDKCDPNKTPKAHPYNLKRGGMWTGGDARRGHWPHNGEDRDALILPFCDARGNIWTLQAIGSKELKAGSGTARKVFMKGGLSKGSFYPFTPTADPRIKTFLVAEGFFTAQAACHCFLNLPDADERDEDLCFVVAGSVNNLLLVAYQLKAAHPAADIIILADEGSAEGAEEAARVVDGKVALPRAGLPDGAEPPHGYDFWDLLNEHGAAAVIKAIEAAKEPPPEEEPENLKDTAEEADKEQNQERPFEERQAEYKARFGRAQTEAYKRLLAERANRPRIPTGLKELDAILEGGLEPGLTILQAMPSAGSSNRMPRSSAGL